MVLFCFLAADILSAAETPVTKTAPAKVIVIPIREQISKPELYILRRGLKTAIEQKVDTIVLDMNTPGGALNVTFDMLKALEKFPGKKITYVNEEAISAGSLIAAGTDDIYFAPNGIIGAAAPVSSTGEAIEAVMREKIVSYLKARVRSISEGKGYRAETISAMIDVDSEFKIGDDVIKEKGELLSLTAQEAVKTYGNPGEPLLGAGVAENVDALLNKIHGEGNYSVTRLEVTWSEKLAQYLISITPLLLGLGILGLFIEFKTPGFGFFGIAGIALLGVVFFSQFVAGLSGHEPVLLFALGIVLLIIEIFFIPGSLILGLPGIALIVTSLIWSMVDHWPGQGISVSGDALLMPVFNVMVGIGLALLFFIVLLRFLPKGGIWGKMVLDAVVAGPSGLAFESESNNLLGKLATVVTPLMPSGQVEIDQVRYEAKLPVGFAEIDARVRVVEVTNFGLIVEGIS